MSTDPKLIAVIGGTTGLQGKCMVQSLIDMHKAYNFKIRALTRNPNSSEARKLAKEYPEIVEVMFVDCMDKESVVKAFKDCWGVFAYTTPFVEGKFLNVNDESAKNEIQQGINMIDAAIENKVSYFVFGSVISANLNPPVLRFRTKYHIENYLLEKKTSFKHGILIVRPSWFMENFNQTISIKHGFFSLILSPNLKMQWIAFEDVADMISNAFHNPQLYSKYDALDLSGDEITPNEIAQILSKVGKHEVKYIQASLKDRLMFKYNYSDAYSMFNYAEKVGFHADIKECPELYPKFQTFEQFISKHYHGKDFGVYQEKKGVWNIDKSTIIGAIGVTIGIAYFCYQQIKK